MSLEGTVRALLDDAAPALRRAFNDTAVDAIINTVKLPVRDLLQRAYEVGYREGLATRPTAAVQSPAPAAIGGNADEDVASVDLDWDDDFEPDGEVAATASAQTDSPPAVAPSQPSEDAELRATRDSSSAPGLDWGTADEGGRAGRSAPSRQPGSFRIFPHATIGTLRERIVTTFGLERFDIEVIVTRRGDKTRRQLKGSVKLSKYLLETEAK